MTIVAACRASRSDGGFGLTCTRFLVPVVVSGWCIFLTGCRESATKRTPVSAPLATTTKEFKEQLVKFKMQRDKLQLTLSRLDERKAAAVARLEKTGVRSKADVAKHPECRIHIREIQSVAADMKPIRRQIDAYDSAIARLDAKLRELDRQALVQGAKLSTADINELSATILDLNEQLKLGTGLREDLEIESVLEDELDWKTQGK
jgi:predicted metalloprotease